MQLQSCVAADGSSRKPGWTGMAAPRSAPVVWEMTDADDENAKACQFHVQLVTFNEQEGIFYAPRENFA